jgi:Secretion system C-terminal sorting domain
MKLLLRKYLLISILTYAFSDTKAQVNSLFDGSFEDTTINWQSYWGLGCLVHWSNLTNSGSYSNIFYCHVNRLYDLSYFGLPSNSNFFQRPYHGGGIIGGKYWNPTCLAGPAGVCASLQRSKMRTALISSKQYCLTIHLAPREFNTSYFSNGCGVYLDNGGLDTMVSIHGDSSGVYPFVNEQWQCPFIVTDTLNWTEFQQVITATGTEVWFNLGNFQTDSATLTQVIPCGGGFAHSDQLVDAISLIPMDLNNWLHDTFTSVGDSVWVGLDKFDYFEGQWYSGDLVPISTEPGFWFTPSTSAPTQFIHKVKVCGVWKTDTCTVYVYPSSIGATDIKINNRVTVWPNPSNGVFTVEVDAKLQGYPLQVFDIAGKVIHTVNAASKTVLDLSILNAGVYVVRVGGEVQKIYKE